MSVEWGGTVPNLTDLDLIKVEMVMHNAPELVLLIHSHLRYLGLSCGWIDLLERGLGSGLRLPQLCHLELSNITSEYMATTYSLVSAQLSTTVVQLDFRGESCSIDATRSFIDAFTRVNTIECGGVATETVLGALFEV